MIKFKQVFSASIFIYKNNRNFTKKPSIVTIDGFFVKREYQNAAEDLTKKTACKKLAGRRRDINVDLLFFSASEKAAVI